MVSAMRMARMARALEPNQRRCTTNWGKAASRAALAAPRNTVSHVPATFRTGRPGNPAAACVASDIDLCPFTLHVIVEIVLRAYAPPDDKDVRRDGQGVQFDVVARPMPQIACFGQ